jgi:FtsZ-binding cell division protein ZapB
MQLAEHDIQGALGMYSASLGQPSNEKSGKAIIARQREGDTGTFHYHDNLARAIRHLGRILVDMIPKVYDSNRTVRIIGQDGETQNVKLNPQMQQASYKAGGSSIYNLNIGIYDVAVSTGPSYTTKRQEAAEGMAQLFQGQPQLMSVIGDLFFRNLDWPGSEDIADRMKLMLPPQIAQAEQKDGEQSPEVQAVMAQAEQAIQQKDQSLQQAVEYIKQLQGDMDELKAKAESKEGDTQAKMGELQIKQAELSLKEQESQIKAFEAETERMTVTNPEFEEWKVRYESDVKLELARIDAEKELELARLAGGQKMAEKAMDQMMPDSEVVVG